MHLANAVAAAAAINNTVSVIASGYGSGCNSAMTAASSNATSPTQQHLMTQHQNTNMNSNVSPNKTYSSPYNNNSNTNNSNMLSNGSSYSNNNNHGGIMNLNNSGIGGGGDQQCHSPPGDTLKMPMSVTGTGQPRRRRTRCKICAACQRSDCGECGFCLDMVKFGGPGRAKQTCLMRQCLAPMLPVTAQCAFCHLDGWGQTPISPQTKQLSQLEGPSSLMECSVCYEISHPECAMSGSTNSSDISSSSLPSSQSPILERVKDSSSNGETTTKGIVNADLPNSWECPSCCRSGKNNDYKVSEEKRKRKARMNILLRKMRKRFVFFFF